MLSRLALYMSSHWVVRHSKYRWNNHGYHTHNRKS